MDRSIEHRDGSFLERTPNNALIEHDNVLG